MPLAEAKSPRATGRGGAVHELFFAGVVFRLECASVALAQLVEQQLAALPCARSSAGPGQAHLGVCALLIERSLEVSPLIADDVAERALDWSWQGNECRVEAASAWAQLRAADESSCSGRVAIAQRRGSLEAVLGGVSAALLYRRGGAVLHAAAIELDGEVLAFIGPSGSGKSTAARRSGAPLFTVDRLALLPPAEPGAGWLACALPGGTSEPEDAARSRELVLPLKAVLRVGRQSLPAAIVPIDGPRSLAQLRAAIFQGTRLPADERALLDRVLGIVRDLPLAQLDFSRDSELAPLIRRWLRQAKGLG